MTETFLTVVSTEQYAEKLPSSDIQFPDKNDLVNYTKTKDIAEIIIPKSLVEEKLNDMKETGEYIQSLNCNLISCKVVLLSIMHH